MTTNDCEQTKKSPTNNDGQPSTNSPTINASLLSWIVYIVFVILRIFVGPFLPGYVHPDEFFQGGQELWFGCSSSANNIPWEFEPDNALRSILPPTMMTWLPLQLYSVGQNMHQLSGREILLLPRIACGLLSVLLVDTNVWSIATTMSESSSSSSLKQGVPMAVLLLATSWPTLVLLNRPFSNAMETCFVALLLANIVGQQQESSTVITLRKCMILGAICALGIFTRFTFVFFSFPAIMFFLYQIIKNKERIHSLCKVVVTGFSFLVVSAGIVVLDTQFYASRYYPKTIDIDTTESSMAEAASGMASPSSFVLTPWNALSYNSKVSNLKEHGLHPRWTHSVVNMFLLFGPMTLVVYISLFFFSTKKLLNNVSTTNHSTTIAFVCGLVLIFGLGMLSLAPHQELRFLLPLIVPLVLLVGGEHTRIALFRSSKVITLFAIFWIVFNTILLLLFGVLHQSGVVYSLLAEGSSTLVERNPLSMIYFHTYMPPSFLSRPQLPRIETTCTAAAMDAADETCPEEESDGTVCRETVRIVDLKGSDYSTLYETIQLELSCSGDSSISSSSKYIHLAMPPSVENMNFENNKLLFSSKSCSIPDYDCQHLWSSPPHLTTEDIPSYDGSLQRFFESLTLNIYEISCPRKGEGWILDSFS